MQSQSLRYPVKPCIHISSMLLSGLAYPIPEAVIQMQTLMFSSFGCFLVCSYLLTIGKRPREWYRREMAFGIVLFLRFFSSSWASCSISMHSAYLSSSSRNCNIQKTIKDIMDCTSHFKKAWQRGRSLKYCMLKHEFHKNKLLSLETENPMEMHELNLCGAPQIEKDHVGKALMGIPTSDTK